MIRVSRKCENIKVFFFLVSMVWSVILGKYLNILSGKGRIRKLAGLTVYITVDSVFPPLDDSSGPT